MVFTWYFISDANSELELWSFESSKTWGIWGLSVPKKGLQGLVFGHIEAPPDPIAPIAPTPIHQQQWHHRWQMPCSYLAKAVFALVDVVGETRHLFQAPSLRPLCHRIHWSHLFLRHSDIVCFLHSSSKFWTREQLFRYAVFDGWSFLLHGMNFLFLMKCLVCTRLFNVILPPLALRARCWQLMASWAVASPSWTGHQVHHAIQCM